MISAKNFLLFCMPLFLATPAEAEAKPQAKVTVNDQFKYAGECKVAAEALGKKKGANQDELNLSQDLETLDNMVRIINDSSEDADFRSQLMGTAESIRQSVFYSLEQMNKKDPATVARYLTICGLAPIADVLHFKQATLDEIAAGMDGVDSGDESDPEVEQEEETAPVKEPKASVIQDHGVVVKKPATAPALQNTKSGPHSRAAK